MECESYTTTADGKYLIVIDKCGNMLAYQLTEDAIFLDVEGREKIRQC